MGVSRLTGLEIFTNADDLTFSLKEVQQKFALAIFRGPKHNYKLLVSSQYDFASRQDAIDYIKKLLEEILVDCIKELSGPRPNSFTKLIINPDNRPLEDFNNNALNQQKIDEICTMLVKSNDVSTF